MDTVTVYKINRVGSVYWTSIKHSCCCWKSVEETHGRHTQTKKDRMSLLSFSSLCGCRSHWMCTDSLVIHKKTQKMLKLRSDRRHFDRCTAIASGVSIQIGAARSWIKIQMERGPIALLRMSQMHATEARQDEHFRRFAHFLHQNNHHWWQCLDYKTKWTQSLCTKSIVSVQCFEHPSSTLAAVENQ